MAAARPQIVTLTPLKNDAWILPRFLEVTSQFSDVIIVADEGSTDGGLEILRRFPKVIVIDNSRGDYDEAARQNLLIAKAREAVPLPRILVALDADEILAANALDSAGWQAMLGAAPGTSIFFEKPNLYLTPQECERRPLDFPGAFVDDGVTQHRALRIHSRRLPAPEGGPQLVLSDVKFLHYALVRPEAQKAKMRMYAVLENVMQTKSLYWRRRYYWSRSVLEPMGSIEPTPEEWFSGWERAGIDMRSIEDVQPYWQDLATLEMILKYGSRRFWLDDIWKKDWNAMLLEQGMSGHVSPPPRFLRTALNTAQSLIESAASLRRRLLT
ncbi:MAG TPA: glycosyltransferase family 2 protein [Thermoanaerobaculia bacterium]|nr:glycosyltransferase family 2 protein [Thermoanaerobaculia bacterium]